MGRLYGYLSVVGVMAVGLYLYSTQIQNTSAPSGTNNPKATVNIVGVKNDLISIASAERGYFAAEAKYASLDELIAGNYISVARQRPPYTYQVETSGGGFRVVATRSGDGQSGAPAELSVNENMEFQTSQ